MEAIRRATLAALLLTLLVPAALAGPLRERLVERRAAFPEEMSGEPAAPIALPPGVVVRRDIPYGSDPTQRFDVYAPAQARGAPIILMVHGGAWFLGDKGAAGVVANKVARWVPRGFILVSVNYRLLPKADPLEQARDVARALAAAQAKATAWGGERERFILMGHSAGAHLVALLAASPTLAGEAGAAPWLGTVALDSAALDVEEIMTARHPRFYDRAFGKDPGYWRTASPLHVLAQGRTPILAVCSSRRDNACPNARGFAEHARRLGVQAQVLPEDLSHREINERLGEEGGYTDAVEAFLRGLDPALARFLPNPTFTRR